MTTLKETTCEKHPWEPFLPENAKVLLLGSFPPPKVRWSMDFYYPNITNDFWKIIGLLFFDNPTHFLLKEKKGFDKALIEKFLNQKGIAMYDAATVIRRAKGNASDQHLEIVEKTDIAELLNRIPNCTTIAVTGEKAAKAVLSQFNAETPMIGECTQIIINNHKVNVWRMPSTSRAYPLALEKKARYYKQLFEAAKITFS